MTTINADVAERGDSAVRETTYGLTEGDLNHGQLMLEHFLFIRPIPGWSNHKTPIDNLYLCGSGDYGGGGVSSAVGRNVVKVLK